MPWYKVNGMLVHLKLGGKAAKNPPAPCAARTTPANPIVPSQRCCGISQYLCDFRLPSGATCDMPLTGYAADHSEGFGALNAISELLLMLSLDNVSTRLIEAPQKLNAKRLGQGKLPLYDYHVLLVDGEETARSDGSDSLDRMVRAHFRRGHIRRLPDSRRVWVRAAYVHGRADGFVDKDYLVKLAAGS